MNGVQRTALVGRKTRRAPDAGLALQLIRAGFETLCGPVLSIVYPNRNPRSYLTFDAATPAMRLKPGAVRLVMMERPGRAEVFALPARTIALHP